MTEIHAWLYGRENPIVFEFVEEYHDTRKTLDIIQEEQYLETRTRIFKTSLQRYTVFEHR